MNKILFLVSQLIIQFSNISSLSEVNSILDSTLDKPKKDIFKTFYFLYNKEYDLNSEEGINRYKTFNINFKWINEKNTVLKT